MDGTEGVFSLDVKQFRKNKGLSVQNLSDITGITIQQLYKIERGEINLANVTAKNYLKICKALDIEPFDLLKEQKN